MQNSPFAALYILGELKISKLGSILGKKKKYGVYMQRIAKGLATNAPRYSRKHNTNDADATLEQGRIMKEDTMTCEMY